MKGLFLGLANGTTCLAVCAPVLVPFLMHEGASIRQNLGTLLKFLGGRLGGYVLFGLLAWAMGSLLVLGARYQLLLTGVTYVGLALLLLLGVLPTLPADDLCGDGRVGKLPTLLATTSIGGQSWQKLRKRVPRAAPCALEQARATFGRWPAVLPAGMGFLAAINICPPLLLAFTDAASTGTLLGSLLLFLTFFLGTSIYFIPLSLLGVFRRVGDLRIVGQIAAVLVALYYLVLGITYCAGGVR
jgi:sulfite exporter TauE/SafE